MSISSVRDLFIEMSKILCIVVNSQLDSEEANTIHRKSQMHDLNKILTSLKFTNLKYSVKKRFTDAFENKNVILAGDLGFHFPGENQYLDKTGFHDLWLEKQSHFDGLTWDPDANSMNHLSQIFDNRRLRPDRICMKESKQLDMLDIKMIATSPIRNRLYASDHFGVEATFTMSEEGFIPQKTSYKTEFSELQQWGTGYRTDSQVHFMNSVSIVTLLALVIFSLLFVYQAFKSLTKNRNN